MLPGVAGSVVAGEPLLLFAGSAEGERLEGIAGDSIVFDGGDAAGPVEPLGVGVVPPAPLWA